MGGHLSQEQLYDLKVKGDKAVWTEIKVSGDRPGPRYGHSLTFAKPNLILFGGSNGNETMNDTWCLNLNTNLLQWIKLEISGLIPTPRVYHSADLCQFGGANGMIIIFGGRNGTGQTLNEVWGLRRHRDGKWDWTRPPERNDQIAQLDRYQHRSIFYGSLMFNVGGKINDSICNNFITVYDYEHNKWYSANGPECFRHVCWIFKDRIFVHGGLNSQNKILSRGAIQQFSLAEIFKDYPELVRKILTFQELLNPNHQRSLSQSSNEQTESPNLSVNKKSDAPRPTVSFPTPEVQVTMTPQKMNEVLKDKPIPVILPGNKDKPKKPVSETSIENFFIENLLRPKTYVNLNPDADFPFKHDEIVELCNKAQDGVAELWQRT